MLHADAEGRGHWKRFVAESTDGNGCIRAPAGHSLVEPSPGRGHAHRLQTTTAGNVTLSWANASIAPAQSRVADPALDGRLRNGRRATPAQGPQRRRHYAGARDRRDCRRAITPGAFGSSTATPSEWSAWSDPGTFGVALRVEDVAAPPTVDATGRRSRRQRRRPRLEPRRGSGHRLDAGRTNSRPLTAQPLTSQIIRSCARSASSRARACRISTMTTGRLSSPLRRLGYDGRARCMGRLPRSIGTASI